MSPLIEYYQPTFLWLHKSQDAAIRRALLDEPLRFRRDFFSRFEVGVSLSGEVGHQTLRSYLDELEQRIAKMLKNHSALYWLHLYRRIGPRLSPYHTSNTDPMTVLLVRDIVECAICKYGQLADIGDIRPASVVPDEQILGGYFIRRLRAVIPERSIREEQVEELRRGDQFVLRHFRAKDFVAIYGVEGFAYEYWLTTARLRSIGKGEVYVLQPDFDLRFVGDKDLNDLFTSYDMRLHGGDFLPVDVGTIVSLGGEAGIRNQVLMPVYNVAGDTGEKMLAALHVEGVGPSVLNFLPRVIPIDNFLESHTYLADQFDRQRRYSLQNFLRVVAALSWRVFMPERSLARHLNGDDMALNLGFLNALRRGYVIAKPELSSISRSVIWYLETVGRLDKSQLTSVEADIDKILSDLTLDSSEKQMAFSLWSHGPRRVLIPSSGAVVVDGQGLTSILRTLFVGLRDSGQRRGTSFEESVRAELKTRGFDLVQRHFNFASGPREADAAIRVGTTLWLIEAHSMWRPLDYEIGDIEVIKARVGQFDTKLSQVGSIRSELETVPCGTNYDVRWAQRIEHCVVSPFVEWVWSRDPALWIDDKIPRLLSVSELIEHLEQESIKTDKLSEGAVQNEDL
jgi:hypothetical protein